MIYAGNVTVSGTNAYSGTTYVTGQPGSRLEVTNGKAFPSGGDLEVTGSVGVYLEDLADFITN